MEVNAADFIYTNLLTNIPRVVQRRLRDEATRMALEDQLNNRFLVPSYINHVRKRPVLDFMGLSDVPLKNIIVRYKESKMPIVKYFAERHAINLVELELTAIMTWGDTTQYFPPELVYVLTSLD